MVRRTYDKQRAEEYEHLLPEFYPVKLIGAFISLDFVSGCSFNCSFCISKRHPSREELYQEGLLLDNRVSSGKMLSWLRSMPSYHAGVQVRIGHDTDAGLEFEKSSKLIEMADPGRSIVYLTRKPLTAPEVEFFRTYRRNLLLKLTATPRSKSLNVTRNPMNLVRSAEPLDSRMLYWVLGPLAADSYGDAVEIIESLPAGSSLFLKPLNCEGLPHLANVKPLSRELIAHLEDLALKRGHVVTEWFCRSGLARIDRGFFDVDKITAQKDPAKRERELSYCTACSSNGLCHGELDEPSLRQALVMSLAELGLTLSKEPHRTGPRSFEVAVDEPASRGEETYLNNSLSQAVSITLTTREKGRSQGGSFCNVDREVLKRWYENGFFPVTELNTVAEYVLRDIRRLFTSNGSSPVHLSRCSIVKDQGICA
ncbi:MAG: hypothetical protein OEW15_16380 [Nitrospirota bacterium]|nr:hypothetical protein [Nitrospirota bacterium]